MQTDRSQIKYVSYVTYKLLSICQQLMTLLLKTSKTGNILKLEISNTHIPQRKILLNTLGITN